MAEADKLFGQIGDDPLSASVKSWGNTFDQRCNLSDFQLFFLPQHPGVKFFESTMFRDFDDRNASNRREVRKDASCPLSALADPRVTAANVCFRGKA